MSVMPKITDQSLERMISILLRTGVVVSGSVVLAGGIYFLARHGSGHTDYSVFRGVETVDRTFQGILSGALHLRARSIIQFGIVLLIATPILRVAFSLLGFALQRDRIYVGITAVVLAILVYSLLSGHAG